MDNLAKHIFDNGDKILLMSATIIDPENFAKLIGTSFAIGVGSGTDALFLSLKALSNKNKSEVIKIMKIN